MDKMLDITKIEDIQTGDVVTLKNDQVFEIDDQCLIVLEDYDLSWIKEVRRGDKGWYNCG